MNDDIPEMLFHYIYIFLLAFMEKKKLKKVDMKIRVVVASGEFVK